MSRPFKRISGTFGRLTVLHRDATNPRYAVCACSCGSAPRSYRIDTVTSGNTRSCGCLQREAASAMAIATRTTHGKTKTYEHGIWTAMLARCRNRNVPAYSRYGAKGIRVCERWHSFENFYADMGPRPDGLTLERDDSNGDYTPENCRWASRLEQNRNRSGLVSATYGELTLPLWTWCDVAGAARIKVVWGRLHRGWPLHLALFAPLRVRLANADQVTTIPASFHQFVRDRIGSRV